MKWEYNKQNDGKYTVKAPHGTFKDIRPAVVAAGKQLCHRNDLIIAEVGVRRGHHALVLLGMMRPKMMYLIDCWEPIYKEDTKEDYRNAHEDYLFTKKGFDANPKVKICKGWSEDVLPSFEKDSFDFIYLDGDHYADSCAKDILNSLKLIKIGGVLGGHDYPIESGTVQNEPPWKDNPLVGGGILQVFEGEYVHGEANDWWVTVHDK